MPSTRTHSLQEALHVMRHSFTHALVATWSPAAKKAGVTYGTETWSADLDNDRPRLEQEANRRNASPDYRWAHYWVRPVDPKPKATDSPQHDDEQAAQEIMALVDSTPNLTAAERDRCQTSLDALRKPKATPNPATTLTPERLTELKERYNS